MPNQNAKTRGSVLLNDLKYALLQNQMGIWHIHFAFEILQDKISEQHVDILTKSYNYIKKTCLYNFDPLNPTFI